MKVVDHAGTLRKKLFAKGLAGIVDGFAKGFVKIAAVAADLYDFGMVKAHLRGFDAGEALGAEMELLVGGHEIFPSGGELGRGGRLGLRVGRKGDGDEFGWRRRGHGDGSPGGGGGLGDKFDGGHLDSAPAVEEGADSLAAGDGEDGDALVGLVVQEGYQESGDFAGCGGSGNGIVRLFGSGERGRVCEGDFDAVAGGQAIGNAEKDGASGEACDGVGEGGAKFGGIGGEAQTADRLVELLGLLGARLVASGLEEDFEFGGKLG